MVIKMKLVWKPQIGHNFILFYLFIFLILFYF